MLDRKRVAALIEELGGLEKDQLVDIIFDLYVQNEENAQFCESRMGRADLDWYKQQIQHCVWPDLIDEEGFDFERADRLVSNYQTATDDAHGTIDLMLHVVEQGNQCTLDYGDIDSDFYGELERMFESALDELRLHPECLTDEIRARINSICDKTDGIGWGYHDTLCDLAATFQSDAADGNLETDEDNAADDEVPSGPMTKERRIAELQEMIASLRKEFANEL